MKTEIIILGCGSSSGVPVIGNDWGKCDPLNKKNRRLRASVLIKTKNTNLLVDATPDLRQQLLNANVQNLDAVLITHTHADHIHGVDDFRFLNVKMKKHLNLYATKQDIIEIKKKFGYIFEDLNPKANGFYYKPCLIPNIISKEFKINELTIIPIEQSHGYGNSIGFRIENFAYTTDVVEFPEKSFQKLKNLDLWIVDCLRFTPHKTHSHLERTLSWVKKIKPKKTVLTHMNYEVDYETISRLLPSNCEAAFDGMKLILE